MAGNYDNTNRGALFPNKRKTEGDNRPDWTGKLDIDGVEYFISAWTKNGRTGEYLSLARQTERPQQPGGQPQGRPAAQGQGGRQGGGFPRAQGQRPPQRQQPLDSGGQPFNEDDIPF
jgi:hypothetical protein